MIRPGKTPARIIENLFRKVPDNGIVSALRYFSG